MTIYDEPAQDDAQLLYTYDLELYPNYFLAVFKEITSNQDGDFKNYTFSELDELKAFVGQPNLTLVGYNNFKFDDTLLRVILHKNPPSTEYLCELANKLIHDRDEDQQAIKALRYKDSNWISIDLMQILGGPKLAGSLKSHEIKLGMLNVQDLPYPPGSILSPEQIDVVTDYCQHDVNATETLYLDLRSEVEVRHQVNQHYPYLKGSALRRSNASIAEEVMKQEFMRRSGLKAWDIRKPERYFFDPGKRLDSALRFTSEHNQTLLERLKALKTFETKDWIEKKMNDPFIFKIGQHTIALGSGGAHTIIGHCAIESEAILEFDVASYYPSLLRKFNTYPVGLTQEWITILNELTDARLEAKHQGDKGKADVYKIIINSLFGKLADQFSLNRDNALQLQVTLNGQLYLIMLMERFQDAGFEVISGNTDGVYINAGNRLDDAHLIADQWMQDSGFSLESKTSTRYVATAINDYALYHPDKGWFHKRGRFALSKRTKPAIITDAVLHAISTGEPVERYIRQGNNILDFLYSGSVRDKNVVEIRHGAVPVQKTNRWYKSLHGQPIEKCVRQTDGSVKWSQVSNSDHCTVANQLSSFTIPADDLDFDHYIQEAETLLNDIRQQKAAKEVIQSKLIAAAQKAQAKGLVIVPKGRQGKGNEKAGVPNTYADETIRYWKETPLDQAQTGMVTKVLALILASPLAWWASTSITWKKPIRPNCSSTLAKGVLSAGMASLTPMT